MRLASSTFVADELYIAHPVGYVWQALVTGANVTVIGQVTFRTPNDARWSVTVADALIGPEPACSTASG